MFLSHAATGTLVVFGSIGFGFACWGLGKFFASKVSPTLAGTPTAPNAQTEANAAANAALVPTSDATEVEGDMKGFFDKLLTDVKSDL